MIIYFYLPVKDNSFEEYEYSTDINKKNIKD